MPTSTSICAINRENEQISCGDPADLLKDASCRQNVPDILQVETQRRIQNVPQSIVSELNEGKRVFPQLKNHVFKDVS